MFSRFASFIEVGAHGLGLLGHPPQDAMTIPIQSLRPSSYRSPPGPHMASTSSTLPGSSW